MAALLALSAAVAYGVGDFLGGVAARRVPATAVVLWSHLVGLVMLASLAPVVGGQMTSHTLVVGAAAGVLGATGVAIFYRALSVGAMSVVAPVAALLSAAVPVTAGLAAGERPTSAALGGIGLALGAVVLISREPREAGGPGINAKALGLAVVSGIGFGLFFVALDQAGGDSAVGIWPLVGARIASVSLFAAIAASGLTRSGLPWSGLPRGVAAAAVGAGVLDVTANVLYVLALRHGLLSIVSALTALYPASTVLLARYVLGERLSPVQCTGLGIAGLAAVLIAV